MCANWGPLICRCNTCPSVAKDASMLRCNAGNMLGSAVGACLAPTPWRPLATVTRPTHKERSQLLFKCLPNQRKAFNTLEGDAQDW